MTSRRAAGETPLDLAADMRILRDDCDLFADRARELVPSATPETLHILGHLLEATGFGRIQATEKLMQLEAQVDRDFQRLAGGSPQPPPIPQVVRMPMPAFLAQMLGGEVPPPTDVIPESEEPRPEKPSKQKKRKKR